MQKTNIDSQFIDSQFSNIIRAKMTDKQFWNWVSEWYDGDDICRHAEEWEEEDKKDLIKRFNNNEFN